MMDGAPYEGFRILLKAPLRQDEVALRGALTRMGLRSEALTSEEHWSPGSTAFDIGVCTQEGLSKSFLARLQAIVRSNSEWSERPLILLIDRSVTTRQLRDELGDLLQAPTISILRRPVSEADFAAAVTAALTARRKQAQIYENLKFQEELKNELNHRLKNTLSTVVALYRMSLKQSNDLADFDARFMARLNALTAVQEILRTSDGARRTIEAIASAVLSPYKGEAHTRIEIKGLSVPVSRQPALAIALIFNELATNAAKYGALSRETGQVDVVGSHIAYGELTIRWQESGGPAVVPPERTSYGTRFIVGSAAGLGGQATFDYAEGGLICTIVLKLDQLQKR